MIDISTIKLYNESATLSHVKALAFKRKAGTEGETKCINYILQELHKEHIEPTIESFEWTNTLTIIMKLIFTYIFINSISYLILLIYIHITWIILPFNILFIIIIYYSGKKIFDNTRIIYIGKRKKSKNIITTFKARDLYHKRPVIIISSHHDTTSLRYSMTFLKILYIAGVFLILSFLILTFILSIWSLVALFQSAQFDVIYFIFRIISLIMGTILLVVNVIILGNKKSDNSIGSIDNASGVAILIELAKLIKQIPLEKTDVIFIWCGAEEMGLWGSIQYCKEHFEELLDDYDLESSYNINIDMVGTYIGLIDKRGIFKKKPLNENLNDVLDASAKQQSIALKRESIKIGIGSSDHASFHAYAKKKKLKKFQVSAFISDKDTKFIHSTKDTPDKCSAKNLNNCVEICYNAMKSLDLRVEPKKAKKAV
ncbi:MAG: M28 family metallopeptidase [Candidatus Thorarchaeota archaeon]